MTFAAVDSIAVMVVTCLMRESSSCWVTVLWNSVSGFLIALQKRSSSIACIFFRPVVVEIRRFRSMAARLSSSSSSFCVNEGE